MKAEYNSTYQWPSQDLGHHNNWQDVGEHWVFEFPESPEALSNNSQWPAFFPCPMALAVTEWNGKIAIEKVVGASIVNRFPYILAVSFCIRDISSRHYARKKFCEALESSKRVSLQFLEPGKILHTALDTIAAVPDEKVFARSEHCQFKNLKHDANKLPILEGAYLEYQGFLQRPSRDLDGLTVGTSPWYDAGSHRIYFFEIDTIRLRSDISAGKKQIHWNSLPKWEKPSLAASENLPNRSLHQGGYTKGYQSQYFFPSKDTVAFEADCTEQDMQVKFLPRTAEKQVQVDNDKARWPCFFPSSVGMITMWTDDGLPNVMPCGSTSILNRDPLMICPAIAYSKINERYNARASLEVLRKRKKFGCGVPFEHPFVLAAIRYAGNISLSKDPYKFKNSGLTLVEKSWAPLIAELPIHFECEVVEEIRLGTHILFMGKVRKIYVHKSLSPKNPLMWQPWAFVV